MNNEHCGSSEFKPVVDEKARLYSVDSSQNGIDFGEQKLGAGLDPRDYFYLRLHDDADLIRLRSRYALNRENPFNQLELNLIRLSQLGVLSSSTIYFGTASDPFLPFEGKFDASMKFLQLFERYTPGMLIVQTRSPLLVIAMPIIKKLGRHAAVTIGIETNDEKSLKRYAPGIPSVKERLQAIRALRRLGVEVTIQVAPVLPYGDWRQDADKFAELLVEHADYIHIKPLNDGLGGKHSRLKNTSVAKTLAGDRKFHFLKPDAATPLLDSVAKLASHKLKVPLREHLRPRQVDMFAA